METEATTQQRRPESVLASEAEKRANTANGGRPVTSELTNQTQASRPSSKRTNQIQGSRPSSKEVSNHRIVAPHNTPRDSIVTNGKGTVGEIVTTMGGEAVPSEKDNLDDILDEDELFMTLTPQEREEWDKMITEREQQLESSKDKHKNWSDSFTRRRMFAYARMRKLNLGYENRVQLFTTLADKINLVVSNKSSEGDSKRKTMKKTMSEPVIQKIESVKTLKRNKTSDVVSLSASASDEKTPKDENAKVNDDESLSIAVADGSKKETLSRDTTPVCKVEQVNAA